MFRQASVTITGDEADVLCDQTIEGEVVAIVVGNNGATHNSARVVTVKLPIFGVIHTAWSFNTDDEAVYYPRAQAVGDDGADLTDEYMPVVVSGRPLVTIASNDEEDTTVTIVVK